MFIGHRFLKLEGFKKIPPLLEQGFLHSSKNIVKAAKNNIQICKLFWHFLNTVKRDASLGLYFFQLRFFLLPSDALSIPWVLTPPLFHSSPPNSPFSFYPHSCSCFLLFLPIPPQDQSGKPSEDERLTYWTKPEFYWADKSKEKLGHSCFIILTCQYRAHWNIRTTET